jgi:hypothetical protein
MRFIALFIIFLLHPTLAWACSCAEDRSMSEIVTEGAVVILASPVGGGLQSEWKSGIYPKRLKIWKTYVGESSEYETIQIHRGSTCAASFPRSQISLIVTRRDTSGDLQSNICSDGGYTNEQWKTYFKTGEETPPRDMCFMDIKNAFDEEEFLGKAFKLSRPECGVHLDDYVRRYTRNP